jgi:hypothetical protein
MVCLRVFLCFLILGLVVPIDKAFSEAPKPDKRLAPLQIFENSPLVFGTILAVRGPAKIILYPNGKRDIIGDVDLKPNDTYAPSRLAITGERNTQVDLLLDPKISLLPIDSSPSPKTIAPAVEDFVLFSTKIGKISDVARLNHFGMDTVLIGATLSLSPESPAGTYTLKLSPPLDYHGRGKNSATP